VGVVEAKFKPRRHNCAKEKAGLITTGKLSTVLGVRHFDNVSRTSSLDEYGSNAQEDTTSHEILKVCSCSLKDGPENAYERPKGHPNPTAIYIGARPCKERACKVSNDIHHGDKALVIGIDAKVILELWYG
jgi:hypothetical protein